MDYEKSILSVRNFESLGNGTEFHLSTFARL